MTKNLKEVTEFFRTHGWTKITDISFRRGTQYILIEQDLVRMKDINVLNASKEPLERVFLLDDYKKAHKYGLH